MNCKYVLSAVGFLIVVTLTWIFFRTKLQVTNNSQTNQHSEVTTRPSSTDDDVSARPLKAKHASCIQTYDKFDGVKVKIYTPDNRQSDTLFNALIYFHGGGWVYGDAETSASSLTTLCVTTGVLIVSVDYRLAPSVTFPVPFDDCVRATKYLLRNGDKFHVNSTRIAVSGGSAGGNLAAAVALKLRDDNFLPRLRLQLLFAPVLQGIDFQLPSMLTNRRGLTAEAMCHCTALYLEGHSKNSHVYCRNSHIPLTTKQSYWKTHVDVGRLPVEYTRNYVRPNPSPTNDTVWKLIADRVLSPYFGPLLADRLDGLPQAYVMTVDHDPLRDEGLLYVDRLRRANVAVIHRRELTGPHSMLSAPWVDGIARFIVKYL